MSFFPQLDQNEGELTRMQALLANVFIVEM